MSYAVQVKDPRPGHLVKRSDLLAPGAAITLAAFSPENGASMAVLRQAVSRACAAQLVSGGDGESGVEAH